MNRHEKIFSKELDFKTLSRKSISGGVVNISAQIIVFIIQFSTLAFMARLVSPDDFGLVAMAQSATGFILIFKDLGLSMATVQKNEINEQQVSNLFWVNIIISISLMILIILLSPLVAYFFKEQAVANILVVSAIGLLFGGFTIQHQALLRRNLQFRNLAIIDVTSKLIGSIISVAVAYYLRNYWALVIMPVIISALYLVGITIALPWFPKKYKKRSNTKGLLIFGKNMTFYGIINYFARSGDNIIIGKFVGSTGLGYYSRAYSLMMMPIGQLIAPLTGVLVPVLSRIQDNPLEFKKYYLEILQAIAYITFPLITILGVMGDDVVLIILGDKWAEAILLYKILCIAAFWQPILSSTGWILISLGQTSRILKWGWINSVLLIIVFLIGINWGPLGVAIAYSIYMWLIVIPNYMFSIKYSPIKICDFIESIKKPFISTIILAIVLCGMLYLNFQQQYMRVIL